MIFKNYLNIDLLIDQESDNYQVRVLDSPVGQAATRFKLPFSARELEENPTLIGNAVRHLRMYKYGLDNAEGSKQAIDAKTFGERLFQAVFADDVGVCLQRSLDAAQSKGKGLRIRLRLTRAPELTDLPWEYLYNPTNSFFVLSNDTPIVRYLEINRQADPLIITLPLRILAVIADPRDVMPRLQVELEWSRLQSALDKLQQGNFITLERLQQATLTQLQDRLRQDDIHILHFIGHGQYDTSSNAGGLLLEDEDGRGQLVSTEEMTVLLRDHHSLRLVFLNACEGAKAYHSEPFSGPAQSLIQSGVPAVIAMQFVITDRAAILLATNFYKALVDGYPVDAALAEARKTLYIQNNKLEWGTPVLYMRSPDAILFHIQYGLRNDVVSVDTNSLLDKAVQSPINILQERDLYQYYSTNLPAHFPGTQAPEQRRVFISYESRALVDEALALQLYTALSQHYKIFINKKNDVDTVWYKLIQTELESCDVFIPLLSKQSVQSEMIEYEISTAHRLSRYRGGNPLILPVRVDYAEPFEYPLSAYLNHINWTMWKSEQDTAQLINELLTAIAGGTLRLASITEKVASLRLPRTPVIPHPRAFADPKLLEAPHGTMDIESRFYIERSGDEICRRELARQGVTVVIKGPRQMGKSSMLVRATHAAVKAGKTIVSLDFQLLDEIWLTDPKLFFKGFCHWIGNVLDIEDLVENSWQTGLSHVQLCTRYMERHILATLACPLILAIDEVDRMLGCPFSSDFFGMLRSWHNRRYQRNPWGNLDLLMVISTEPYLLMEALDQSPFNVGEVIRLTDFTPAQVADLNDRHGGIFSSVQLTHLWELLGGQPYLVRQALYKVACGDYTTDTLISKAIDADGPFRDHLQRYLIYFSQHPEVASAMRQILKSHALGDDMLVSRLNGAGLVLQTEIEIVPRCGLYAAYFGARLGHD